MDTILKFIGGVAGIIGIISALFTGFLTDSILNFFLMVFGSAVTVVILFALARIIENQEKMLAYLWKQERFSKDKWTVEPKTCSRCSHVYDGDMKSCPNCGFK